MFGLRGLTLALLGVVEADAKGREAVVDDGFRVPRSAERDLVAGSLQARASGTIGKKCRGQERSTSRRATSSLGRRG